jgi:hypothetical protein
MMVVYRRNNLLRLLQGIFSKERLEAVRRDRILARDRFRERNLSGGMRGVPIEVL